MSQVNIKNFVDIDIIRHIYSQNVGTRDTVALFSSETYTPQGGSATLITSTDKTKPIKSLAEAAAACGVGTSSTNYPNTYQYLKTYFENGGVKAIIIGVESIANVEAALYELESDYICIAYVSAAGNITDYENLKTIAKHRAEGWTDETDPQNPIIYAPVYGVDQKLILARKANETGETYEKANVKNFIVKYSKTAKIGFEMTIAAYLSKINVYRSNTVYDYMFTIEKLYNSAGELAVDSITDEEYKELIGDNINFDIVLANELRNCGGNCSDGDDVVNAFARIVLQQTVTNSVLETLVQKLKNQSGLNKIYSTIANELENYKTCGYLTTDKLWDDDNLYIEYNGKNYLIIEKGTPIQNGYFIKILPFATLSAEDKTERKTPPIYIIIAEQYGIRKITINGEAI